MSLGNFHTHSFTNSHRFEHLTQLASAIGLEDHPTPFLAIDLNVMEQNIERMASYFRSRKAHVRPHVKHHKCTEIARMQIEAGAIGVTCATTDEVAAMARGGINDILLANVVTDPARLRSLAASANLVVVTAAVDSNESALMLSSAAQRENASIGVVVDIDIGMGRNGVESTEEALALAMTVAASPGLEIRGVMAYEGHLVEIADERERSRAVTAAFKPVAGIIDELETNGFSVVIVTGGSTATYRSAGDLPIMTDVQAGTYVLMDATYVNLMPEFHAALVAVATVSTSRPGRAVVLDIGTKRLSTDWGRPELAGFDAVHTAASEEHNRFRVDGPRLPSVGERVAVVPAHSCSTVSMYRRVFGCREGRLEKVFEIDARDPLA